MYGKSIKRLFGIIATAILAVSMAAVSLGAGISTDTLKKKYSADVVVRVRSLDPNITKTSLKVSVSAPAGGKITQKFPSKKISISHGLSSGYKEVYRRTIKWDGVLPYVIVRYTPSGSKPTPSNNTVTPPEEESAISFAGITIDYGVSGSNIRAAVSSESFGINTSGFAGLNGGKAVAGVESGGSSSSASGTGSTYTIAETLQSGKTLHIDLDAEQSYTLNVKSTGVKGSVTYNAWIKQKNGKWLSCKKARGCDISIGKNNVSFVYSTLPDFVSVDDPAFPLQFKVVAKAVNSGYKAKKSEQIITLKPSKKNKPVKKTVTFRFTKKGGSKK